MIFITLAETERCILSSVSPNVVMLMGQFKFTRLSTQEMRLYLQLKVVCCVVLWRSSTKLANSPTSRYWPFSGSYRETHYIPTYVKLSIQVPAVLLTFLCPWWWCVFLAKWHSAIMHCAHHRLCWWAVMKNEEAQQNWLLTPWLHGTERFLAGMRRHTTYVKLNNTGTGSSLNFSCPWWWCVFLARWLCDDVHCVSSGHH